MAINKKRISNKNKKRVSKRSKKSSSSKRRHQRGGVDVSMPSEYYGSDSGRYASVVNPSYSTAYGASVGISQGMPNGMNSLGPNLAYGPTSGTNQTGGKKKRSRRSRRCSHRRN